MELRSETITHSDLQSLAEKLGMEIYNYRRDSRQRTADVQLFTLRPINETYRAYSDEGRKLWAVSWEGHRDFMVELFDMDPEASLKSALATYKGRQDFWDGHAATRHDRRAKTVSL